MSVSRCLEASLREYRTVQSIVRGVPRHCIFDDAVLRQLVAARPTTDTQLRTVKGLGTERCTRYGEDILRLVRSCLAALPPPRVTTIHGSARRLRKPSGKAVALGFASPDRAGRTCRGLSRMHEAPPQFVLAPAAKRARAILTPADSVYVLELAHDKVYVGKSADVARRVGQHLSGYGSAWTREHPPTGVMLPRLGNVQGSGDAAERDETLRYMRLRGIQNVRGWRYTTVSLSQADADDAEANIRELYDLCRRCGTAKHFISQCRATVDRNGKPIY